MRAGEGLELVAAWRWADLGVYLCSVSSELCDLALSRHLSEPQFFTSVKGR